MLYIKNKLFYFTSLVSKDRVVGFMSGFSNVKMEENIFKRLPIDKLINAIEHLFW